MTRRCSMGWCAAITTVMAMALTTAGGLDAQVWLDYNQVTGSNIVADPLLGTNDPEEKDYTAADFDLDGDIDLIVARKLPFTTFGNRPNVLFMNVDGVMIDQTATYAPEFISSVDFPDGDNSRDVMVANIDGDAWPDVVFANAGNQGSPGQQPRLYINLGEDTSGNWLGFEDQSFRMPYLLVGGQQPNACAVGIGDVTGNGFDDIYIVDYNNSLEDKLLINDGTGNFTEETDARLPSGFENSGFATAGVIADMNGDGYGDIVKDTTPSIRIAYNDGASNPGFFSVQQNLAVSAAYHFDVGDIDGDGMLDIYVVQDGQDQWQINTSPVGAAPINWASTPLSTSPLTGGFGGNVYIEDLDGDLDNDIVVADIDTDVPSCSRTMAFLRNDGGSLADPYAGQPLINAHHQGTYDVAVADFNNDGANDLWVGHCDGTDLYFSNVAAAVPPVTGFSCVASGGDVTLSWANNAAYENLAVKRDGVVIANLGGGMTSYVDLNPGSGVYSYSITATIAPDDSPPAACSVTVSNVNAITGLTCEQIDEDASLNWTNNGGVFSATYDSIELSRNGVVLAVLPGTATSYLDVDADPGNTTYILTAFIGGEASAPTPCTMTIINTNVTDLVLRFDATLSGDDDSAQAIHDALIANVQVPILVDIASIDDLTTQGIDMAAFQRVWVELGTFPNEYNLPASEGQLLADYVNGGGSVYLSGGDTHCFDAGTPIHDLTGVADSCSDGGGILTGVEGVAAVSCDLDEFDQAVPYDGESGFIDRLSPLTTGEAVLEFSIGTDTYTGGVFNAVGSSVVIAHSVELGAVGEAHDQEDLVGRYLSCFPSIVIPTGPEFIRGDVNQDGGIDISDPIALLDHLFSGQPADDCLSSLDTNDDGAINIADTVFELSYLFTSGADPAAPFPTCGEEDTPDSLTCDSYACP